MRLRNWKETVEPTIIDTLEDVHPHTLEEPFQWYAKVGSFVWVKTADGKWRRGQIVHEESSRIGPKSIDHKYSVRHSRNKHTEIFIPMDGVMKPDTHEVRVLLREAGYFV